ncbi:MAG: hypothetical protein ACLUIQ_01745 [Dialister invisus]
MPDTTVEQPVLSDEDYINERQKMKLPSCRGGIGRADDLIDEV